MGTREDFQKGVVTPETSPEDYRRMSPLVFFGKGRLLGETALNSGHITYLSKLMEKYENEEIGPRHSTMADFLQELDDTAKLRRLRGFGITTVQNIVRVVSWAGLSISDNIKQMKKNR